MKRISSDSIDYFTRHQTYSKKKYVEKVRYISKISLKTGTNLLMTPKPPFGNFKTVEDYLRSLYSEGVETIVVFLEKHEENGLIQQYEKLGFNVIHFPIKDFSTPNSMEHLSEVVHEIRRELTKHSVAMHCFGGNGRTGLVAASILVQMGMRAEKAINFVRKYRPEAIETDSQEKFIHDFEFFERFVV